MYSTVDRSTQNFFALGAMAQFERDLIKDRQHGGIALAERCGVYTNRRKTLAAGKIAELSRYDDIITYAHFRVSAPEPLVVRMISRAPKVLFRNSNWLGTSLTRR